MNRTKCLELNSADETGPLFGSLAWAGALICRVMSGQSLYQWCLNILNVRNLRPIFPLVSTLAAFSRPFMNPEAELVAPLVGQRLKCLPAMREIWVRPLGWEDPLEKEMGTHSSILAWNIPWSERPGTLQPPGSQKSCA